MKHFAFVAFSMKLVYRHTMQDRPPRLQFSTKKQKLKQHVGLNMEEKNEAKRYSVFSSHFENPCDLLSVIYGQAVYSDGQTDR